ncbi:MAG TPA: hypothetical protein VGJ69_06230 [Pyrinomonadaceae bacterium]|jgi:hypothetical protein
MGKSVLMLVTALLFVTAGMTTAAYGPDNAGPSANGTFQFTAGDDSVRYVSFNARIHNDNTVTGEMSYTDPAAVPDSDTDNSNTSSSATGLSVKASFDCVVINGNRAVMGGVIVESNVGAVLGRRVLLVVEDNDQGINAPGLDKLTWGVYRPQTMDWTPADAELENDIGATLHWTATDFERPDDVGIPSHSDPTIRCQSFPLSSYAFIDVQHGFGNIQVKP